MAEDVILDLWTFDAGAAVDSPEAYAEEAARRVEESWDSGADLVVLPEFMWMGLEPWMNAADHASSLHAVAHGFWHDLFPALKTRLTKPGKAVVLGTCPWLDEATGCLHNRAVIFAGGERLHQDKLHLTPWENAMRGGDSLRIWEFAGLRIAVIICLDIEIPELSARLREREVDLILCPSATETILGVERVDRCASARAVELGCYVGVAHLVGRAKSELIDENVGRVALYRPSQAVFGKEPRWTESEIFEAGFHRLRTALSPRSLQVMRRFRAETNPSHLGKDAAGMEREIQILEP